MLKIHGKLFHILCTNMAFHPYGFFHVNVYVGLGGNIFHNGRNWRASLLYEFFDVSSRVFYEKMFFCIRCTQTVFHLCASLHCDVSEYLAWRKTWDNSCKEKFAFHLNAIRGVALVFPIENIWIDILCTKMTFLSCEQEDVVGVMMHGQWTFHKQCTRML